MSKKRASVSDVFDFIEAIQHDDPESIAVKLGEAFLWNPGQGITVMRDLVKSTLSYWEEEEDDSNSVR